MFSILVKTYHSDDTAWVDLDGVDADDFAQVAAQAGLPLNEDENDDFQIVEARGFGDTLNRSLHRGQVEDAITLVSLIEEHGESVIEHVASCASIDGIQDYIDENGCGLWSGLEEWARDYLDQTGILSSDLPDLIANNIDWKGIVDDLAHDFEYIDVGSKVFVIRNA